jgi:hypothetical protein
MSFWQNEADSYEGSGILHCVFPITLPSENADWQRLLPNLHQFIELFALIDMECL